MKRKKKAPRLTPDERQEFVLDYCAGRVVASNDVPVNIAGSIFMPMLFGGLEDYDLSTIGVIYGVIGKDKTLGMAINGFPMFASCRILPKEDMDELAPVIDAELQRRKDLKT